ncbi:biotin-dependent carboxyltransferase family protein [Limnobacter humi]|uniref:Biotin-dependent carboxyltransferase family protein n=1 Tax=Limnobacter humi TaxID=1778671 RepID=A0ABT1WEE0_9BURK|nr:biotin-dependent carboxyltransferase family protein [Limnobacter humi]MCQ8895885.1 biotin-dependent carboxyltransferase family protein [Limnobacter humi]
MFKVVKAQGLGLVSDLGRFGLLGQGVPQGGVMDPYSFSLANLALGNHADDAGLEFMGSFELVVSKPGAFMLATRSGQVKVNKALISSGRIVQVDVGDIIQVHPALGSLVTAVCVRGGIQVPAVLGSRGTCLSGGFGGYSGRALRAGDEIRVQALDHDRFDRGPRTHAPTLAMPVAIWREAGDLKTPLDVRCLPGPELKHLGHTGLDLFAGQRYTIEAASGRQAYRLKGHRALPTHNMPTMRSHAVHPGVVQLPPSGQPMVLMCDAQATGGYPRLATVLHCDMWKLGQASPGQRICFRLVDHPQAVQLNQQHEQDFQHTLEHIQKHVHQR